MENSNIEDIASSIVNDSSKGLVHNSGHYYKSENRELISIIFRAALRIILNEINYKRNDDSEPYYNLVLEDVLGNRVEKTLPDIIFSSSFGGQRTVRNKFSLSYIRYGNQDRYGYFNNSYMYETRVLSFSNPTFINSFTSNEIIDFLFYSKTVYKKTFNQLDKYIKSDNYLRFVRFLMKYFNFSVNIYNKDINRVVEYKVVDILKNYTVAERRKININKL